MNSKESQFNEKSTKLDLASTNRQTEFKRLKNSMAKVTDSLKVKQSSNSKKFD
jgi:hypothetical protein